MNNLTLYQITNNFPIIMEQENLTDELKEEMIKELTLLLQQKSQNIIGYVRNNELTIEAMKNEEKRISEQRKALENRIQKFKDYVKDCMENNNITKIETSLGTLTIAKNPISIEIVDEKKVPEEYKKEVTEIKILKDKIKNDFKETGEIPDGIKVITTNTNLRIK